MSPLYPCPCCGYEMFDEPPGSYQICDVCGWEDDDTQIVWPTMRGCANASSLFEAQAELARSLASGERVLDFSHHERDPLWRPFDPQTDPHLDWLSDGDYRRRRDAPHDARVYYWRPDYWLRRSGRPPGSS